jgi:hypothetical protein
MNRDLLQIMIDFVFGNEGYNVTFLLEPENFDLVSFFHYLQNNQIKMAMVMKWKGKWIMMATRHSSDASKYFIEVISIIYWNFTIVYRSLVINTVFPLHIQKITGVG